MFSGTWTALVTPFDGQRLDEQALRGLIERQIAAGIHGLVICGTTGEAAAMTIDEQLLAIRIAVEQTAGRVPVIAGSGTNNTARTAELTGRVAELGVAAALVVTPYYVKPSQAGLIAHYQAVARIGLPIVAYNVPSRTGVGLTPESVARLAEIENLVAVKEASGDLNLGSRIIQAAGERLAVLSGDDFTCLPLLAIGGRGVISVVSNLVPAEMVEMIECFDSGDLKRARAIHHHLFGLMQALFVESNPMPVKEALALMGLCRPEFRLPLTRISDASREKLAQALRAVELIEVES